MITGSDTHETTEETSASNGRISCQDPLLLSSLETGRYDDQMITFQKFEKDDVIDMWPLAKRQFQQVA